MEEKGKKIYVYMAGVAGGQIWACGAGTLLT